MSRPFSAASPTGSATERCCACAGAVPASTATREKATDELVRRRRFMLGLYTEYTLAAPHEPVAGPGRSGGRSAAFRGVPGEQVSSGIDCHGSVVHRGGGLPEPDGDQPDLARVLADVPGG